MDIIQSVPTKFETVVLGTDGKRATGLEVEYLLYNSTWSLVGSGDMVESLGVYSVVLNLATLGQYTLLIATPTGYEDGMEQISVIEQPAKEASVQAENEKIARILGLVQENFRAFDHVYDSEGNQTSSTVKIYGSASDCNSDINPIATYAVTATYTSGHKLTSYKVTKV